MTKPVLPTLLDGRHRQLNLYLHWKLKYRHRTSGLTSYLLQQCFPSLFQVTHHSLTYCTQDQNGQFFGALYNVIEILAVLILQRPSVDTVFAYCAELQTHLRTRTPGVRQGGLRLVHLAQCVQVLIERLSVEQRLFAAREVQLDSFRGEEKLAHALELSSEVVERVFEGLMDAHHEGMHRVWTTEMYLKFAGAFRNELIDEESVYRRVQSAMYKPEKELEGVSVEAFCIAVDGLPASTVCSICLIEMDASRSDQSIVGTKCAHFFHRDCLSNWVKSSGTRMSPTCPTCRTVLFEPREKTPFI
ncbi:hypothetical protein FB567DRAFT_550793 [Paraphoma chrysanthemicola]|uniref:RING-type domain-containing protein n=1 Tax=Paraphoma chrysanthemicola TaxID=798071 RepID=A0A8K0R270_9PLEO|nr:hypothetical protein FB567DRAFT_550793 [Paraphoma chrysanthemicola]